MTTAEHKAYLAQYTKMHLMRYVGDTAADTTLEDLILVMAKGRFYRAARA